VQRVEAERAREQHEEDLAEALKMASAEEKQQMLLQKGKAAVKSDKEAKKAENLVKKEQRRVQKSKPKAARSAYMLFCNNHRAEVVAENPEFKMAEVNQVLATKWKTVQSDDKENFLKLSEEDKIRHHKEMTQWLAEQNIEV